MLDIKAILAILAGVVVVGGVGTYVYLENSNPDDQLIPVSVNPAISAIDTAKKAGREGLTSQSSDDEGDSEKADSTQKETDTASGGPTENWKMPAFDVLRVEPDGSTVIAGQGQPNTTLKILNGGEVLNEVKIGPSGDFAVIFDQPLNSGDYQLTLSIEDEDGNSMVSQETAIISVPEEAGGQLLAMVTKPGKASRILTQPTAPVQTAKDDVANKEDAAKMDENIEVAANTISSDKAMDPKTQMPIVEPDSDKDGHNEGENVVAAEANEASSGSQTSQMKTTDDASVATKDAQMDNPSTADMAKSDDKQAKTAMESATATEDVVKDDKDNKDMAVAVLDTGSEPASDPILDSAQDSAQKSAPQDAKVADEVKNTEASSQDTTEKPVLKVQPKKDSIVRIEAVEVEGDKLFVAGIASQGNTVRILVDGIEVGAVDVSGEGRFLIETQQELSVGPHMITAALEDKSSKKIVLRAIVPFNRPEAESAAAIAKAETKTEVASSDAETKKLGDLKKPEQMTAAGTDKMAASKQDAEVVIADAEKAIKDGSETMDKMPAKPETTTDETSDQMANKMADKMVDDTMATANDNVSMNKDEPQTIVQDVLTPASSQSVIIRKGDTLWQIARRTYGAGVRYTTIYLANQEQILNPDRIAPGQIFTVPEEALENAEELHKKRLLGN